jgi:protein-tyrosine phosphatase
MAQGLLAAALPRVQVRSAGLNAMVGMPADETAVQLMQSRGIDITAHRAVQITRDRCQKADLVLVMSTDQRQWLQHTYPFVCGRVYRLGEFSKRDVPDPFKQGERAFEHALAIIEEGLHQWLPRLRTVSPLTHERT